MMRFDKYGIQVDEKCYVVGIPKMEKYKDKKGVEKEIETLDKTTYHSGLGEAIKNIRKRMHMEALKKYDGDLDGALDVIAKVDAKFDRLLAKIEKEFAE